MRESQKEKIWLQQQSDECDKNSYRCINYHCWTENSLKALKIKEIINAI